MGKDWPTHRVSDIFQITLSDMRQCRACHYHPTCAFASERQSREERRGWGVIMGVAHYHRPWTWFVGASVFLSRTRSPTFKPGSISHLSLQHLAPAFKRIRILNLGLCLLGIDSCKSWSLFCEGIHQIGDAYHMRNAP